MRSTLERRVQFDYSEGHFQRGLCRNEYSSSINLSAATVPHINYRNASWLDSVRRQTARSAADIDVILWIVRAIILLLIIVVPWYYGTVDWTSQSQYLWWAIGATVLAFLELIRRSIFEVKIKSDSESETVSSVPWPAFIFVVIALWATLQSIAMYSIEGSDTGPNSVGIQRLFLGEDVPSIAAKLNIETSEAASNNQLLPDELKSHKLAWSIEPLHTKGAIGMLALIAALIWFGHAYFSSKNGLLYLLATITIMGVAIAMFGIAGLLSWSDKNALGLGKASSFGPFISRNSGGCYMNVCLSAAMGLTTLAFGQSKSSDRRYSNFGSSIGDRLMTRIEAMFGQLTTFQIASVIATGVILASVISTASRGASISAGVSVLAVFLMTTGRGLTMGRIVTAALVLSIGAAFLLWFELDERLRERFAQADLQKEFEGGRVLIWGIAISTAKFFFWTGSGLGTFHFAHLPFQTKPVNTWFYNAENLYLEAISDLGWVGLLAIIAVFVCFVRMLLPDRINTLDGSKILRLGAARVTALALLVSVGLHSCFDFSMILPACFVTCAVLFGAIFGASAHERLVSTKVSKQKRSSSRRRLRDLNRSSNEDAADNLQASESKRSSESASRSSSSSQTPSASLQSPNTHRIGIKEIAIAIGLVALMVNAIPSLDLLARADRMRLWTSRQQRMPKEDRSTISSVITAGIWGKDSAGIEKSPDATRILALAILNEFQTKRSQQLEANLRIPLKTAASLSTPTITHVGLKQINRDEPTLKGFFIDESQQSRWQASRQLLQKSLLQSPLDWRTGYGLYLLGDDLPDADLSRLASRLERTSIHRPNLLVQVAVIEYTSGRKDRALRLLASSVDGNIGNGARVAQLLLQWYRDGEVPVEVFEDNAAHLLNVAYYIPAATFPITHQAIIERAEGIVEKMSRVDPMRSTYLATIAKDRGDLRSLLVHLQDINRRKIGDINLQIDLVRTAIELGEFELADETLMSMRFSHGQDTRIQTLDAELKKARDRVRE
jgi:O-antigen ligase